MMDFTEFEGKHVVVTGAAIGIGRAICTELLGCGARVTGVFNSSSADASALEAKFSGRVQMRQVDLADRNQTLAFVAELLSDGRPIHGLVNNAGIVELEQFERLSYETWDRTFEVNVTAPLVLTHGLRSLLVPGAAVVNISSTDAFIGSYASIAYSASKAALNSLTQSLADVLGPMGVRAVAICPGWIETAMATEEASEGAEVSPLGRNGRPEEIAKFCVFLLSDHASFITGSSLVADGGYTCVDVIMKKENDGSAAS